MISTLCILVTVFFQTSGASFFHNGGWSDCTTCAKDGNNKVTEILIMAETSEAKNSGSDDSPWLKIKLKGKTGWQPSQKFPDLPGNDLLERKTDMWTWQANNFGCFCWSDIYDVNIKNGGNDGWSYKKMAMLVQTEAKRWFVVSMETGISDRWIDGDGGGAQQFQDLPLLNSYTCEDESAKLGDYMISQIYVIATTGHDSNAGSDDGADILITYKDNVPFQTKLPDLPGDDMLKDKSDWWVLDSSFGFRPSEVKQVDLVAIGSNGWNVAEAFVIAKTKNGVYTVLAWGKNLGYIQTDKDSDHFKTVNMNRCPESAFYFTDAAGYWELIISGHTKYTVSTTVTFEESNQKSEEHAKEFSKTIGDSQEYSVTVEAETPFCDVSASASTSFHEETTNLSRDTVSRAVTKTTTAAHSTSFESDLNDLRPAGEPVDSGGSVLWGFVVGRFTNQGSWATLQTRDVQWTWGRCKHVKPNCYPGFCSNQQCRICNDKGAIIDIHKTKFDSACKMSKDPHLDDFYRGDGKQLLMRTRDPVQSDKLNVLTKFRSTEAQCNKNDGCVFAGLTGSNLCCPTADGVMLACCIEDVVAGPDQCRNNPGCVQAGLTGSNDCCSPAKNLACCAEGVVAGPDQCRNNPGCVQAGLTGSNDCCSPAKNLACCAESVVAAPDLLKSSHSENSGESTTDYKPIIFGAIGIWIGCVAATVMMNFLNRCLANKSTTDPYALDLIEKGQYNLHGNE